MINILNRFKKFFVPVDTEIDPFFSIPVFLLIFNFLLYAAITPTINKNILRVIAILFFSAKILKINKIRSIDALIVSIVLFYSVIYQNIAINILVACTLGISVRKDRFSELQKQMYYVMLYNIFIYMICFMLGQINDIRYIGDLGRVRHTLGFSNVNQASLFFGGFILLILMKNTKKSYIVAFLLNYAVYLFTNSRTLYYAFYIYFVLYICNIYIKKRKINIIFYVALIGLLVMELAYINGIDIFMVVKNKPYLDRLLSYRGSDFYSYAINENKYFYLGGSVSGIDNFYLMMIYGLGILPYVLFMLFIDKKIVILFNETKLKRLTMLMALLVLGNFESAIVRPETFISILFWVILFNEN